MRRACLTVAVCGLFLGSCPGLSFADFPGAAAQAGDVSARDARPIPPRSSSPSTTKDGKPAARTGLKSGTTGDGWWKTTGALTVALAFIFLTAKVLRRTVPAVRMGLPDGVVQVLGRKVLDYRHTLHLVRFGSRMLILGTSQDGMRTLSEITDPVEIDYLAGLCKSGEPTSISGTFSQLFQRFQNPGTAPDIGELDVGAPLGSGPPAETEPDSDPAILRLQRRLHPTVGAERERGASPSAEVAG